MPTKRKRRNISAECDRLASKVVRARGFCEVRMGAPGSCGGNWQCCHIIGRRYRSVRWDFENLLCGCRDHHVYWTHRPEGFVLAVQEVAPGLYESLWRRAQEPWDKSFPLEELRERAAEVTA